MRVLILGGAGMLGHKLFQRLRMRFPETNCTLQGELRGSSLETIELFRNGNVFEGVDASDFGKLLGLLSDCKPSILINCIGVIKQRSQAKEAIPSITINALLPHVLARACSSWGGRLIHFSTDCVFNGVRGQYTEEDLTDASDLYGRTKALGEVVIENSLTLRTSIIGRELAHSSSLLEWFLSQDERTVHGYTKAIFSGVTTNYLAELVGDLISEFPNLSGLYQVASQPISKFELLVMLRDAFRLRITVDPDDTFVCDRSLRAEKFERKTGHRCPPWAQLIHQMVEDTTPYEQWRTKRYQAV